MQDITRRAALRGTAAVAAVAAAGAAGTIGAANPQDGELLALSDQYWTLRDEALQLDRSAPGKPRPEYDAIYDRVGEPDEEAFAIATRVAEMPAFMPGGLAAKLRIIRLEAGFRDDMKLKGAHYRCQPGYSSQSYLRIGKHERMQQRGIYCAA